MLTAKELGSIPRDLKYFSKFNNLKSSVLELINSRKSQNQKDPMSLPSEDRFLDDEDTLKKLELTKDKLGNYVFPELLVNVMMEYAYRQGKKDATEDFEKRTRQMDEGLKKVADILDDLGYVNEEEY